MKTIKVGINGFGRIGRMAVRTLLERQGLELAAVNDLTPIEQNTLLLKYDSVHGAFPFEVKKDGTNLVINNKKVEMFNQKDPSEIPWAKLGVDIVFECTGVFTSFDGASKHLKGGAKKVIVSAPVKDNEKIKTFVMGINEEKYNPSEDHVVSNASCTTNCLAPVVKVLHDHFKVQRGLMTTIHSYTNDQRVLDIGHSDLRRMRAAGLNLIPTTTGAAKAVSLVMPELKGKLTGLSVRVPTPNVSLVDFVCDVEKSTTAEEVNKVLEQESTKSFKGILQVCKEPLVSSDFNGSKFSSVVDADYTMVMEGKLVKVLSWYDNETGFTNRMIDLASLMAKSL
jgi:glyceraldehyde 3-phosphate dehydrogenase